MFFIFGKAQATHIVGGDLTYTYNGGTSYTFTLTLYRDCQNSTTTFPNPAGGGGSNIPKLYVYYSNGFTPANLGNNYGSALNLAFAPGYNTNGTVVSPYYYSPCLTFPSGICVRKAVYTATTNLPATPGGYTIMYQNCCRNSSVNFNININQDGATYLCEVPGSPYQANSSPVFTTFPPIAICQNAPFSFPCGATDANGDQLVYSLNTPFNGTINPPAGFGNLTWNSAGGYSLSNFLGGTPSLAIDPNTGVLTCYPPNAGTYCVGIKVEEYRNGVYIGSIYRDIQFNINPCVTVVSAAVANTAGFNYVLACGSKTVAFTNNSTPINGSLTTFFWNFGDPLSTADTSKLQSPSYTYADTGTYTAVYIMNPGQVGSCSDTVYKTVKVYDKPFVNFGIIGNKVCTNILFRDSSIIKQAPAAAAYKWSFGDGTFSTSKNPSHVYTTSGNFNIKLVITQASGCKDSLTKVLTVIGPYPTASINVVTPNCKSKTISFAPGSSYYSYLWNFGDLNTLADSSISSNPSYTYPDTGAYTVTLKINQSLAAVCRSTATVVVKTYPPFNAGLKLFPNPTCVNTPILFTDTSKGSLMPNYWSLNYGDASPILTSTVAPFSASHAYSATGTYSIKFLIKNSAGCRDSVLRSVQIQAPPVAAISVPPIVCNSMQVAPAPVNTAYSYAWDFGQANTNSDTSTLMSPAYTYLDTGAHQIRLILNPTIGGTCTDTATAWVKVYSPLTANFVQNPSIACIGNSTQFVNLSSGIVNPSSYQWTFSDGFSSTALNPIHAFNAIDTFQVKLVANYASIGCSDSTQKDVIIYPIANAIISTAPLQCQSLTVNFTTPSIAGTYSWNFGDMSTAGDTSTIQNTSYTYPDTGTYTVRQILNIGMSGTCSDTVYKTISVYGPLKSYFKYGPQIVCPNYPIQFVDSSYGRAKPNLRKWDFGDASPIVYGSNVTHAYANPGSYNVTLIVFNAQGCADTSVKVVNVLNPVPPNFAINAPTLSCRNTVAFSSNYAAPTYLWNFGEPSSPFNTSSFSNPTHAYVNSGYYSVTLIAYPGTGCADTAVHVVNVQFGLQAGFDTLGVCVYDSAVVQQQTIPGPGSLIQATWHWGDGDSSSTLSQYVKHLYQNAGTYQINMVVTNSWGCQDSIQMPINIYPRPNINIGTSASICNLDTVKLTAQGGGTYQWSPNYAIDSLNIATPKVTPDKTTLYQVKVVTPFGCFDTASVLIKNVNPPSRGVVLDTTICYGDSALLRAGPANLKYTWLPNYNISSNKAANPWAFPLIATTYIVRIVDGACVQDDTFRLNVVKLANPNAGQDITICKGSTATLQGSGGIFYNWSPNTNMSFSNTANPVVYPDVTTTYTLTVIDTFSCLKPISDKVTVRVEDFNWAYAGADTSGVKGIPIELHAEGGVSYSWQPIYGLDNPNVQNPSATLDKDMTYVVTVTSANGCIDYDTIFVVIFPEITAYVPNAFTPNGDGVDDIFIPIYAGVTGLMEFSIYNRWGNKVFTTADRSEGWDGHYKGQDAEIGTYVWMIRVRDLTGAEWLKKGDVTLIR